MSLIAVGSGRSPGLTTTVHAMALVWPKPRRCLIAELDADGGTLAARHAITSDPGLVSFAAAGRRGFVPDDVLGHCQQLSDGTPVLVGPTSPDRAASALATLGARLGRALDTLVDYDVLADCGRLDSRSPVLELISASPYLLLVVEPSVEGVAHLAARLPALPLPPGRVALVCIGDRPYRAAEVAQALNLPVLGVVAHDPRGAAQLAEGRPNWRSPLLRSAAGVTAALAAHLPPLGGAGNVQTTPTTSVPAVPDPDPLGGRPAGSPAGRPAGRPALRPALRRRP
jgi:hypothetical protein